MAAPRSLPIALKPYTTKMSPGSAFGVKRKVNGIVTSTHNGIDFPTPVGLALESGIEGTVSMVGGSMTHQWGYYLHVRCKCPLRHEQEFHILRDKPGFKVGDPIRLGQVIGHTGQSGGLNGSPYAPHHHQGASVGGRYYDPLTIGWARLSGGATPLDNTEGFLMALSDAQQAELYDFVKNTAGFLYAGGKDAPNYPGMPGTVLQRLRAVQDLVSAPVHRTVDGGLQKIAQIQDNADTNTFVRSLVAQVAALQGAVSALALGQGNDPDAIRHAAREGAEEALRSIQLTVTTVGD